MDRMQFIPGREAREEILSAQGRIMIEPSTAANFADEFILPTAVDSITYQTALSVLSEGDRIEVTFGLRNPKNASEEVPSGELVGFSTATFIPAQGEKRVIWETGRRCELLHESYAQLAFEAYKEALSAFLARAEVTPTSRTNTPVTVEPPQESRTISRALSPTSLYMWSGIMFYFVDLAAPPGSTAYTSDTKPRLSRPMRAYDAVVLSAILTLVWDYTPVVFGIAQHENRLGKIPGSFKRVDFVEKEGALPSEEADEISVVI